MRIETTHGTSTGLLARGPGLIPEWRVGAVVAAVAVRDPGTGQLWLEVGNMRHPARIASGDPAGPASGEALRLRVLRNSPVLAFETIDPSVDDTAAGRTAPEIEALRRLLPRQSSPAGLLANASWLARTGSTTLPDRVAAALLRLWQALPEARALATAQGLEAALRQSGQFLEHRLASPLSRDAGRRLAASDLKALLLALNRALDDSGASTQSGGNPRPDAATLLPRLAGDLPALPASAPSLAEATPEGTQLGTLARQAEGMLARLTSTQLLNLGAAGMAGLVELPLRQDGDATLVRLRWERESPGGEATEHAWSIEAVLTLRHGEQVHLRVTLADHRVRICLRSDSAPLVIGMRGSSERLATALVQAGLKVDGIACVHGMPAGDAGNTRARLLDTRA